ncbi:MAG: hypothetical protein WCF99_14225 [Chloroflexales bacterium]
MSGGCYPVATALDASIRRDVAATMARLLTERERRFLRAYFFTTCVILVLHC